MKQGRNEREIVLDLLLAQHQKGTFMNVLVRDALDRFPDLEPRRRAFIKRLAEGVVERKMELDAVLDRYSKKPMSAQKPKVRIILRMGLYQLLYMDSVPASAACNESVRLAKRVGLTAVSGYINGLLRNITRDLEAGKLNDLLRAEIAVALNRHATHKILLGVVIIYFHFAILRPEGQAGEQDRNQDNNIFVSHLFSFR